jgi:Flp pilus assembly protein TadG
MCRSATRLARSLRRLLGGADDISGSSAIEFSIIAPVLIAATICTVDLGMVSYRKLQVQDAAQAGAQYAAVHGFDASSISNAITGATSYSGISASPAPTQFCGCASATGINVVACGSLCPGSVAAGTYVTASAQSTYATILPYPVIANSFALSAQSTVRIQ